MAVKDRIPLRDHFLQITPGFAQDAIARLDVILKQAGVTPEPNQRLSASQVGLILQPLVARLLDLEPVDSEIQKLLSSTFRLSNSNRGLQWAALDLGGLTWWHRHLDEALRQEHRKETHTLIMGFYDAVGVRLNKHPEGQGRDRVIVAALARGIEFAIYSDMYMLAAAKGALSSMSLFTPRGYCEVDFDLQYPMVLGLLDVLIRLQQAPVELPVVI